MEFFKGAVYVVPELKISKKGKEYAMFAINTAKRDIMQVLVFDHIAKRACKELTKVGEEIVVEGTYKEEGDGNDTSKIIARSFKIAKVQESAKDKAIRLAGGLSNYTKKLEDYKEAQNKAGNVLASRSELEKSFYVNKKGCVKVNGRWQEKMEFCMDVLTPVVVTEILRKEGVNFGTNGNSKRKEVMEQILQLAIQDFNGEVDCADEKK